MGCPVKVAVLDLGSSSFRLVVAKGGPGGSIRPVLRKRAPLHLGRVVGSLGRIPEPEATEAVETVLRFRRLAEQAGAKRIITVATSALRDAANREEMAARLEEAAALREVEEETGLRCRTVRYLTTLSYADRRGRTKTVAYWLMEPVGGELRPLHEIDDARWAPAGEAASVLTNPHDAELVERALAAGTGA